MSHAKAHHDHATSGSEHVTADDVPCRTPATPMCCQALISCGAVMSATQARSFGDVGVERNAVPGSMSNMPRSEILAPDPPPPRV